MNSSSPQFPPQHDGALLLVRGFAPNGSDWGQWTDEGFDAAIADLEGARDEVAAQAACAKAYARLVDNPPWLYIVHDLNPRAMTRRVQGFVSPKSWFVDLTSADLR